MSLRYSAKQRAISAYLIASLLCIQPFAGTAAHAATSACETDSATCKAMKQASEDALQARLNNVVIPMFSNVKSLAPSKMSCLDKWSLLDFSSLMQGDFEALIMAIVNAIVMAILNKIAQMICTLSDAAWNAVTGTIASIGTHVTLPGGMGTINVGLGTNNGRVGFTVNGMAGGTGFNYQTNVPNGPYGQGTAPNGSIVDSSAQWVRSGIDRIKSWYQ